MASRIVHAPADVERWSAYDNLFDVAFRLDQISFDPVTYEPSTVSLLDTYGSDYFVWYARTTDFDTATF